MKNKQVKINWKKCLATSKKQDPILLFWREVWTIYPKARDASEIWVNPKDMDLLKRALGKHIDGIKEYKHLTDHAKMVMVGMHILQYAPAESKEVPEKHIEYRPIKNNKKRSRL